MSPDSRNTLTPQAAASAMHVLCQAVPVWSCGALGAENALRLASRALRREDTARQGAALAVFAWQDDPLEPRLVRLVHMLTSRGGCPGEAAAWSAALADWCAAPGDAALGDVGQYVSAEEMLDGVLPGLAGPCGGWWLRIGWRWCLYHDADGGVVDTLLAAVSTDALPKGLSPEMRRVLKARLRAGWAVTRCEPEAASALLAAPLPGFEPWRAVREAECHVLLGHTTEAITRLHSVWRSMPWHPNLTLALYELAFPLPPAPSDTQAPAILLYSWNKAAVLADTLRSLWATDTGDAPVFVLNNGSTDDTATMLAAQEPMWGGKLHVVTLPVNVGAPAARNWLLSLPEVRARDSLVFLDDDLLLTPGWLRELQGAAAAFPRAGVVGCRILEYLPPWAVQSADFFLLPTEDGDRSFADFQERIFVHGGSMGSPDRLLTRHTRPCLSVSGCCHLLRRETVERCGGFDIRFSPSQFDDLERDLRLTLAGYEVFCAGTAAVRHVQHSSLRQAVTRSRTAHVFGNKIKLEYMYADNNKIAEARLSARRRAEADLLRKAARLAALEVV